MAEGGYKDRNFRIIFGLEKYDMVREMSVKSQGIFYSLAAGNPVIVNNGFPVDWSDSGSGHLT